MITAGPAGQVNYPALVTRAKALAADSGRSILGITGAPGAGKTTLAQALCRELGETAIVVPMDGFHLDNEQLQRLGLRDRKGAPETFDVGSYVDMLQRLRSSPRTTVHAPKFDRRLEASVPDAIAVTPEVPLVITEGNYLLLDAGGWADIRALLDEVWFLAPDESARVERLVDRHIAFGKAPAAARSWALGTDQRNADLIAATRNRADLVINGDITY